MNISHLETEVKNIPETASSESASPTSLVSYRHISAFDRKNPVYRAFADAGEGGKAESFMTCGEEVYTLKCESCGYEHKVTYNCKLRFCSRCAGVKMSGYIQKYGRYLKTLPADSVRVMHLTLKNVDDLKAGVDRIRDCFTKLRHRDYYKGRMWGGLYGLEANRADDGKWNVHLHCIYFGSYIPQARLSDDWKEITGDSFYVWINQPRNAHDALRYVLKYITKGIDTEAEEWTGKALVDFVLALSDVRLIQAFGCFLGKVAEREPFSCPDCGECLWRRLDSDGETVYSPLEIMLWKFRRTRPP